MINDSGKLYQAHLSDQFSDIYSEYAELSPTNPLSPDVANRQQILFMQYQMEKRGKNLGMAQSRLFKIENGLLYQVDGSSEQKQLPFPTEISMLRRGNELWQAKHEQYKAKIVLKFAQRSDITVFFKEVIEWREIGMFLQAGIRQRKGSKFDLFAQTFRLATADKVAEKIRNMKEACTNLQKLRVKAKLNELLRHSMSDRAIFNQLLGRWKSKVHFLNGNVHSVKIRFMQLKSIAKTAGTLVLWVQGSVAKQINISQQSNQDTGNGYVCGLSETKGNEFEFSNVGASAQVQFQVDSNGTVFKSERFMLADLFKIASQCTYLQFNLVNKAQLIYLKIFLQAQGVTLHQKPLPITPKHYRIIDEIYLNGKSHFQLPNIHTFYVQSLQSQRKKLGIYVSFNRVRQLFDLLGVQELINKFFIVSPFKDYIDVECKGSAIYEYFAKNYQREHFYDVEKLSWKYEQMSCKKVLFALKSFDQNPKFNFTEPFMFLVEKIYTLAFLQTANRWKGDLFQKSTEGVQALCFFLSLAVVKCFSSLFVQQELVNKRALPYNSLLFSHILQRHRPALLAKFCKIELNIEAYFGQHFTCLFSSILNHDMFARTLTVILTEQKQSPSLYISGLIALFLTVIDRVDTLKCAYLSAQHYILTFEQSCFSFQNKHRVFAQTEAWQKIVCQECNSAQFKELAEQMSDFYLLNSYSGDLGQISRQIYQEFISYHYKNELDLRKIMIFLDKIEVGQPCTHLNLTIFQSAAKIYQHNFKGVDFAKMQHFIELRLVKLQELNIICNNGKVSLSCRLDPKEIPSNLYFHVVRPLTLTYHMSPQANRNIFLQIYIKDNSQIDSLENPLPKKYLEQCFQKSLSKQDLLFCKKFSKCFRMRQNNFNLLYSKLGWFGNHYLHPDDRLLSLEFSNPYRPLPPDLSCKIALLNRYSRVVYGRAVLPRSLVQEQGVCVQLIKQGVLTAVERAGVPANANDLQLYSSASRLLCYCLDNFSIHTSMQFLQFYYRINQKLPLIRYLSYHPKLYYHLPSFTFQVFSPLSTAIVAISHKGAEFRTNYTAEEITEIEDRASAVSKLPAEIQLAYSSKKMLFDEFLYWLRLNILSRVGQPAERKGKSRRWPNSLVSTTISIPNYELHNFYEVMNETKQIIQFEFKQLSRMLQTTVFPQFALIQNRWQSVHCIAQLKSSTADYFYVLEKSERKKYMVEETRFIKGSDRAPKVIVLSDDIANSMEVVTYELNKMLHLWPDPALGA